MLATMLASPNFLRRNRAPESHGMTDAGSVSTSCADSPSPALLGRLTVFPWVSGALRNLIANCKRDFSLFDESRFNFIAASGPTECVREQAMDGLRR